jgi:hypothetical protein
MAAFGQEQTAFCRESILPSSPREEVMKLSEINEYAQTVAGVFAIAGIVFVGIQIQQSNRFADAGFIADFYDTQLSLLSMEIDSDIYATVAKSVEAPAKLSLAELLELNAHYINQLLIMDKVFDAGSALGILSEELREYQLKEATRIAKANFPGEFGRAWIENTDHFAPDSPIRAAVLKGLNDPSIEALEVRMAKLVDAVQH